MVEREIENTMGEEHVLDNACSHSRIGDQGQRFRLSETGPIKLCSAGNVQAIQ